MKILCAVKRVIDANVNVIVKQDGSGVETSHVKMSVNPFCEIGIEEAVRLKDQGIGTEILALSIGSQKCVEQLRVCLALGADRGILVESNEELEPLSIAKLILNIYNKEQPDLVIFGKQSIDGDNSQTGQMFAALANLPQATFASEVKIDHNSLEVTREVDGGLQTIGLSLPAVVTTDLRLNTPRFATLKNIMMSKRKPIDTYQVEELGVHVECRTRIHSIHRPPPRKPGIKVATATELVSRLREEAKVLA